MERVESFLAVEQRVRWCGVGVVDITSFKWYNDTLGHALGDRIIERVAKILSDQIRSQDFLALERSQRSARPARPVRRRRVLLPDPGPARLRGSVDHRRPLQGLGGGLRLAPRGRAARGRSRSASTSASSACASGRCPSAAASRASWPPSLIHRADTLMYEAKSQRSAHVHSGAVRVEAGVLVDAVAQQAPEPGPGEPA